MLAARANKYGEAWPGLTRLADEARVCKRAARKAIREMERRGLLYVDHNARRTNTYRLDLEVFEAAAQNKVIIDQRRALTPRRTQIPAEGNTVPKMGESRAPESKTIIRNLECARAPEFAPEAVFDLLDERWAWETEGKFAVIATMIGGSGIADVWFSRGKPAFALFVDPIRTQGAGCAGISITWATLPSDLKQIEEVMRTMGFDADAIWPWDAFVSRLCNASLPPLEPVPAHRVDWLSAEDAA